jgi:hypothetical protein
MHALKLLFISIVVAVLVAGCGGSNTPSPSNWFTTSSIYAYMKAVQDESGSVTTTVQLRDGPTSSAKYIYLSSGDVLYTSLDKPPEQYMSFSGNLFSNSLQIEQRLRVMGSRDLYTNYLLFDQIVTGKPEYFSTDTPGTNATPPRAYVELERGHAMTGPSFIDLPLAFQISAPVGGASVSRATPVTLTWTNVDATTTMEIDVAVACDDGTRNTWNHIFGTDTGSATLTNASYLPAAVSALVNCRAAYKLQRTKTGGITPQLAFGSFKGVQQRTVQFTITP